MTLDDTPVMLLVTNDGQLGHRLARIAQIIPYAETENFILVSSGFGEYGRRFSSTAGRLIACYPTIASVNNNANLHTLFTLFHDYLLGAWADNRWPGLDSIKKNIQREGLSWLERSPDPIIGTLFSRFANELADVVVKQESPPPPFSAFDRRGHDSHQLLSDQGFRDLKERPGIRLLVGDNFFDDTGLFLSHLNTVREFFTPLPHYQIQAHAHLGSIPRTAGPLIGVHIRHGDYREWNGGSHYHSAQDYAALMRRVQSLFTAPVTFLVCSNERQDPAAFEGLNVFFGHGDLIVDMTILSNCDFIMGPPSGYSMWASMYGARPIFVIQSIDQTITLESFERTYEMINPYIDLRSKAN